MTNHKPTTDAVAILHRRYVGDDPRRRAALEAERLNAEVARTIHALRTTAGLSQPELAARVGTTQSVISRLEDADYRGHSLRLLVRVAAALGHRLRIAVDTETEPRKVRHRSIRSRQKETLAS